MQDQASQILFPRLNICLGDFRQTLNFVRYILEKKLHDKKSKQAELVHLAFETAMIVSYWRPFSKQFNFKGHGKLKLQDDVGTVLTEEQRKLHKLIGLMRDTNYAHSDAEAHLVENFDYGKKHFAVPHIEILRLTKSQTIMLEKMIGSWLVHLSRVRSVYASERNARLKELRSVQS